MKALGAWKTEYPLIVSEVEENFAFHASRLGPSRPQASEILSADVLILPLRPQPGFESDVFPSRSRELLGALELATSRLHVEVASAEAHPSIQVLHGAFLDYGRLLVKAAVVPIVLSIVANLLTERMKRDGLEAPDTRVRFELIVERADSSSVSLKYDGPAEGFDSLLTSEVARRVVVGAEANGQ